MCLLLGRTAVSNNSLLSWGLWNNDVCLGRWGRLIGWANRPENNYQSLKTLSSVIRGIVKEQDKRRYVLRQIHKDPKTLKQLMVMNCRVLGLCLLRTKRKVKLQVIVPDLLGGSASLWLAAQQKKKDHPLQAEVNKQEQQLKWNHLLCNAGCVCEHVHTSLFLDVSFTK